MISKTLLQNSLHTTTELEEAGITISPAPDSLLEELVQLSSPISMEPAKMVGGVAVVQVEALSERKSTWETEEEFILATGQWADDAESQHNLAIQSLADNIAPHVRAHVNFTRNVVVPIINTFENDARVFLSHATQQDPSVDFNILVGTVPEIVFDSSFRALGKGLDAVVNANEVKVSPLSVIFEASLADEVAAGAMSLGSDRLNALLVQSGLTKEMLKSVFLENFTTANVKEVIKTDFFGRPVQPNMQTGFYFSQYDLRRGDLYHSLKLSLAYYLLVLWLMNNEKPSSAKTTAAYMSDLSDQEDAAAVTLTLSIENIRRQVETGVMVTSVKTSEKTITVHQALYGDYLNEGGRPEALLGMLAGGNVFFSKNQVLEKQADLTRSWNEYLTIRTSQDLIKVRTDFIGWVHSYMANSIVELTPAEEEYLKEVPALRDEILKRVDEQMLYLSHTAHEDIAHTALHVVAKARFYYTAAYSILSEMQQVARANKDADPREAANIATMIYVLDYLRDQVTVTTKK